MILSDEQMVAATAGSRANDRWWRKYKLTAGPKKLPGWCKGANINWHDGFSNSPSMVLKVDNTHPDWNWTKIYTKTGSMYKAIHSDGRCRIYHHDGPLRIYNDVKAFQRPDGSLHPGRRRDPKIFHENKYGHEPGEWVLASLRATSQQDGFGGDNIWITLDDGDLAVLRGPWHGGAPIGFEEVSYWENSESYRIKPHSQYWRPWWKRGGIGGLFLSQETWANALATYQAHLEIALVKRYSHTEKAYLEPLKPEWSKPKHWHDN